jgi:hypothetical protein
MTVNPFLCIFISIFVKEDLRRINEQKDIKNFDAPESTSMLSDL